MGFAETFYIVSDGFKVCQLYDFAVYLRWLYPDIMKGKIGYAEIGHSHRGIADSSAAGRSVKHSICVFDGQCSQCVIAQHYKDRTKNE